MAVTPETAVFGVTSALLVVAGLALSWSGARQYRHQRGAVSRAEAASGTIETVDIEQVKNGTRSAYVPAVTYEYQTPTQRLRGTRIYPGSSRYMKLFHSESAVRSVIDNYEPGASTTVYYDRANPHHSFLDPTPHRGPNLARIGFGLGLVSLGVVLLSLSGVI
ncbi:MAG: DUF3592 domain-containing protein [Euryarchaeota archaeon]|nr:DUF3592 domain-containing protein [Euryarchaeota archaeon]